MNSPTPAEEPVAAAAPTSSQGDPGDPATQLAPLESAAGFGAKRHSWLPLAGAFALAAVPVLAMLGARFL